MDINKQEMELMHTMCQKELQELQLNLRNFLLESERVQKILSGKKSTATGNAGILSICGGDGDGAGKRNMFALIAFDRYMSQVGNVVNMARKFNIHLTLNKLTNSVINPAANNSLESGNVMAQSRILQDYIEWSNSRLSDRDLLDNDIQLETLTLNDNLLTFNKKDDVFKKKALESSQSLQPMAHQVKNVDKPHKDSMAKLDTLLKNLFPVKDLSHFQQGYEFSASIVYVQDYKELVFFICDLKDYNILYELSHTENLTPISLSSFATEELFCISQYNSEVERECVWRAVIKPEEDGQIPNSVYLVDCGETVQLTTQCKIYRVPAEYRQTAPLAIKCILEAVQNCQTKSIDRDRSVCEQVLRRSEYKIAQFCVARQENRVLHLVLVENSPNDISVKQKTISNETKTCQQTISKRNSNPFLDNSFVFNDDYNSNDSLDPLPLPISTVYSSDKTLLSMPSSPSTSPLVNNNARLGDKLKILVTHIVNPIKFYAIIEDDSWDRSKAFSWPDHEISLLQKQMSPPKINDIVLAQYTKDGYWYRARVIAFVAEQDVYEVSILCYL